MPQSTSTCGARQGETSGGFGLSTVDPAAVKIHSDHWRNVESGYAAAAI
jgi:hypothetical protein